MMCGCCGQLLGNLMGCCRKGRASQRGKRPDTFLTPYEMEQLPLMVREIDKANRHFWQNVCWRWNQQREKEEQRQREKEKTKEEGQPMQKKGVIDDSYTEGCALRELVRVLAKNLCEKGTFDADAEQMIVAYRARLLGEEFPTSAEQNNAKGRDKRREFALKGRAISFNGSEPDKTEKKSEGQGGKTSSSTSSTTSSSSSGYSSEGGKNGTMARLRAASWLRQRAHSVRDRRSTRRCACVGQEWIVQLGEILLSEFHSTVFAHPEQFDVHERELKLMVWRHFSLMLVALLNDPGRLEQKENSRQ